MTYSQKLKDPRWQKKRLEILNRDNFTCRYCGDAKTELHIHHLSYNGEPWQQHNDKLVTLCKHCHKAVGNIKSNQSFENKAFKKQTLDKGVITLTLINEDLQVAHVFWFDEVSTKMLIDVSFEYIEQLNHHMKIITC